MSSPKSLLSEDVETEKKTKKVDLDTILVEEIGQFGPYQFRIVLMTSLLVLFRGWSASEYVFTTGKINTRCYIPGCDSASSEFSPEWVLSAVPAAGGGLDNCRRYANFTALPADGTCPAHLFNTSLLIPCDSYVYENDHTVVYDFDLGCDEWRRSLVGTIRLLGMFAALPLTGYISDRWGRRTALACSAVNCAWLGMIRYWANNYYVFIMSEFIETTIAGAVYAGANILAMEIMGPKYRVVGGVFTNTFLSIGKITAAMIAMVAPNWKILTLALYAPQLLSILAIFIMGESVRWLMSKSRYADVETLLKKIAKVNKRNISQETLDALRLSYEKQNKKEEQGKKNEWLIVEVFRNKTILLRCSISAFCWMAKSFVYVGLSINATTMSGNPYVNFAAASAAEIPGYWVGIYLMNRIGRKPVLMGGFLTCAACQAAYIFISRDKFTVSLTVFLIGKFTTGIVMLASIIYTTELYPTQQRHKLLAISSFMGSIGSVMAPLTPAFGAATFPELPFVLFGSMSLTAGLLLMLLPETLNARLPDTMEETRSNKKEVRILEPLFKK